MIYEAEIKDGDVTRRELIDSGTTIPPKREHIAM